MGDYFLQDTQDYKTAFTADWDVSEWTAEGGATVTRTRIITDTTHPSCMEVVSDTDGKGVYLDFVVTAACDYRAEFAYKNSTDQELDVVIYDQTNGAPIETVSELDETIWSNLCKDFVTPATCVLIRIYLRAGTNDDTAFYIDDFLCQGNAMQREPDKYTPGYEDVRSEHTMIDGSIVVDRTTRRFYARLAYKFLDDEYFQKLLGVANSSEASYFDDSNVPMMTKYGTIYTAHEYLYTGITNPSGTHKAWYTISEDLPNASGDFEDTEFATGDYTDISVDDANGITTTSSAGGDISKFIYHKFDLILTGEYQYLTDIQTLNLVWKGKGLDLSANGNSGAVIYIWNGVVWLEVARTRSGELTSLTFTTTHPEIAQGYVDPPNGHLKILVRTMGHRASSGNLSLETRYIQVYINQDLSTAIWLKNKAELDGSGDVVEVKNLTQGSVLTLGVDYVIGADRLSIITSGQDAGDRLRVKYNQRYKVTIGRRLKDARLATTTPTTPEHTPAFELKSLIGF